MAYKLPEKIRYAAEVKNVKEVTLIANADPAYWDDKIKNEGLRPYQDNGQAELFITSADLVWNGMRSQELSVSLKVCANDRNEPDGFYLLHAFNSSRFFAWIERKVFHTPYFYADIAVRTDLTASVLVASGSRSAIHLQLGERNSPPALINWQWRGPVFLPQLKTSDKPGKVFFARIEGSTEIFPFDASKDILRIDQDDSQGIVRHLRDSGIKGKEWQIRKNAFHGKSKTYGRK